VVHLFNHALSFLQQLPLFFFIQASHPCLKETIFRLYLLCLIFKLSLHCIPPMLEVPSLRAKVGRAHDLQLVGRSLIENMLRKRHVFEGYLFNAGNSISLTFHFSTCIWLRLVWRLKGYFAFKWFILVHTKIMLNFFESNIFITDLINFQRTNTVILKTHFVKAGIFCKQSAL